MPRPQLTGKMCSSIQLAALISGYRWCGKVTRQWGWQLSFYFERPRHLILALRFWGASPLTSIIYFYGAWASQGFGVYSSEHSQGWSMELEKHGQQAKQREFVCVIADEEAGGEGMWRLPVYTTVAKVLVAKGR